MWQCHGLGGVMARTDASVAEMRLSPRPSAHPTESPADMGCGCQCEDFCHPVSGPMSLDVSGHSAALNFGQNLLLYAAAFHRWRRRSRGSSVMKWLELQLSPSAACPIHHPAHGPSSPVIWLIYFCSCRTLAVGACWYSWRAARSQMGSICSFQHRPQARRYPVIKSLDNWPWLGLLMDESLFMHLFP